MPRFSAQAPASVVMVRPHRFRPNPATRADNAFQSPAPGDADVSRKAHQEVTRVADCLVALGVTVHLFEDCSADCPDAVFPNNWFSTHAGGHVAVYPMFSPSRRAERRADVIDWLKQRYRVQEVIDYSGLEQDGLFLEGTGGMVLDHIERVAYAARSNRASDVVLERFCTHFSFEPMVFDTVGPEGKPIYHTNVLMMLGSAFGLVCLDVIKDERRRAEVAERIENSGRSLIPLTEAQVAQFAGNAIELMGRDGPIVLMSARGVAALSRAQRELIEACGRLVAVDVPTIELAGGSVRCMIAGVHLSPRPATAAPFVGGERVALG